MLNQLLKKIFTLYSIFFLIILIAFISYDFKVHMNYVKNRFHEKITSIESTINDEIDHAKYIIYGLASSISEGKMIEDHRKLLELAQNFDPKNNLEASSPMPFSGLIIINSKGAEVINTIIPDFHKHIQNVVVQNKKSYLNEIGNKFFELNVNPIRIGDYIKEPIIPINMKIADKNHNYIGLICSGIKVRELTNKLVDLFVYSRHMNGIEIVNYESSKLRQALDLKSISSNKILISLLFNQDIYFKHKLNKYPFYILVKLKHSFQKENIERFLFFSIAIYLLFLITIKKIKNKIKNEYENPFLSIQTKLNLIDNFIIKDKKTILLKSNALEKESFSPSTLAESINIFIDDYHALLMNKSYPNQQNDIRRRLLNLAFIEQHFIALQKPNICEEKLYLNKIFNFINEDYSSFPLGIFLEELISYCREFYYEFDIKFVANLQEERHFSFKKTALIETIFTILTFLLRNGFEETSLIVEIEMIADDDFPTISVIVPVKENILVAYGSNFGPNYTDTSLFTLYLLANENKLLLNVIKEENKIIFRLKPIGKNLNLDKI